MKKGETTREAIIDEALSQAVVLGLEGVSLGVLAESLGISKSGLFAHFRSKEALQLAVLETAVERFKQTVVAPAFAAPSALGRLRALFVGYLDWIKGDHDAGGCPFVVFVQEFDDRPGPVRVLLSKSQQDWRLLLSKTAADAIREGDLTSGLDAPQIAFELIGAALSYQVSLRLLEDAGARRRAMRAFKRLTEA